MIKHNWAKNIPTIGMAAPQALLSNWRIGVHDPFKRSQVLSPYARKIKEEKMKGQQGNYGEEMTARKVFALG